MRLLGKAGWREDRAGWEADVELHRYDGMTINERLWEAGLLEEFGQAARARNRAAMIRMPVQVGLSEAEAVRTADATLGRPEKYGY